VNDHLVLIAAAELLPAMKARLAADATDVVAFSDTEALRALEVITTRRPRQVILERRFASTPRGAALINRIKADPLLIETAIKIVPFDSATPEALPGTAASAAPARPASAAAAKAPAPPPPLGPELDFRGTRLAPRFRIAGTRDILVDGNRASLVDLSTRGAQLLMVTILKPNQRVRISLSDDEGSVRAAATVVWAAFEIPKGESPRYRAGLEFVDPDTAGIEGYIRRNKA
jgi:hypothetical protein